MQNSLRSIVNSINTITFGCSRLPMMSHLMLAFLTIGLLLPPAAYAAEAAPQKPGVSAENFVTLEDLFKDEQFAGASLSPNGKYLAVKTSVHGRLYLAVVDLGTRAVNTAAGFSDSDILHFYWINNDRLVFDVIDRTSDHKRSYSGLFAVNRDGSKFVELMATQRKQMDHLNISGLGGQTRNWFYIASYGNDSNDIIVEEESYWDDAVTAYRVNTLNRHKRELPLDVFGTPIDFHVDNKQQIRVITTRGDGHKSNIVWYRDDESQKWRKLAELDTARRDFDIIGFDSDNKTMFVSSGENDDKTAIYKFDFVKNAVGEQVAADKEVDMGDLIFKDNELIGVRVNSEPPRTLWLNADYAKAQDALDDTFPDQVNEIYSGNIKERLIVRSYSATNPGKYSLFDPVSLKLEPLFASRPWIKPEKMADQLIFNYSARDGLNIPSYLTIPKGRGMKGLPLVVLVHGGPWTRDYWGFDPEVQFLASRGYAVLQPEFRGSTGFGWNHYKKGWKTWGLAMQDDITDGVNNLVKQGVVDPARICIMGASYGGYATLMGLIKDPALYRCGINMFGVTDIGYMFTGGGWGTPDSQKYGLNTLVGNPSELQTQFNATSPLKQAAKIKAPVLMVYGGKDVRVPIFHGEKMRDALEDGKTHVEWIELPEEEHGIALEENRYKVYGAIEKFLKTYNPAD